MNREQGTGNREQPPQRHEPAAGDPGEASTRAVGATVISPALQRGEKGPNHASESRRDGAAVIASTTAAAYMRCSGSSQIEGDTWERQLAAIQRYAKAHGIEILRVFRDEGVTGKMELENRDGLSACIQFVREQHVGLVLVESSDRLARDSIVAEVCIREFQKISVRVVSAEGVDLTAGDDLNPTAKLIRQVLAAIAEFDRCVTVNKLRGARQRIKANTGKCEGRKAFGEKPEEQQALQRIFTLKNEDRTTRQIAEILNVEALPSRSGRPWNHGSVAKILLRQNICAAK
jgi:DNA invertase Pin-like site-specific DNA recombinase